MRKLQGRPIFGLFLCAAGAGLRRGEAMAMNWENIEFEAEEDDDGVIHWWAHLTIEGSISELDGETDTKTPESYRICPLAPVFGDRLHAIARESGPVALSLQKNRMALCTVRRNWEGAFKDGRELSDLPYISLGRLRHTNSTIMRDAGVEDSVIADYHGHVDPHSVDQRHYLMPTDESLEDAAELFGDAIQRELDLLEEEDRKREEAEERGEEYAPSFEIRTPRGSPCSPESPTTTVAS